MGENLSSLFERIGINVLMNQLAPNGLVTRSACLQQTVCNRVFLHLLKMVIVVNLIVSPLSVAAVILGDIWTDSGINEVLIAEIPIVDISAAQASQLRLRIFPREDYKYIGLEYDPVYDSIQAQLKQRNNEYYILLTSNAPISRLHLDLLIEARWDTGFLHRHYTLVLDQTRPDSGIKTDPSGGLALVSPAVEDSVHESAPGPDPDLLILQNQLSMEQETLATNQTENEEMRGRIETIETQLRDMQRVIELKDKELVSLQQELIVSGIDTLPATAAGHPESATLSSKSDSYQSINDVSGINLDSAAIAYDAAAPSNAIIEMKTTGDYSPGWQNNITLSGNANIDGLQTGQKAGIGKTAGAESAAQGLNRGNSTSSTETANDPTTYSTVSRSKDYLVDLRIDADLKLPGDPGILEVWIGDESKKPENEAEKAVAETTIPAIGQTAKVKPVAPMFKVDPVEFICMKVHPSGSVATFTLTPLKTGKHDVGAIVHMYETDDCTGAPVPKSVKELEVTVRVGAREKAKEYGLQLWEKFWNGFLEFWEWAVATLFALLVFLIRKQLKRLFGFEDKPNES